MAKPAVKKTETPELPDAQEQAQLLSGLRGFAAEPRFAGARRAMEALRRSPPQSLLLEGGSRAERTNAALYWAALLNCPQARPEADATAPRPMEAPEPPDQPGRNFPPGSNCRPCLNCPVCLRFVSRLHRDLFFFDGGAGNIKIDEVREMRSVLGEPPREGRLRVAIFSEGQALGEAAANALLKSLEEPRPGNVFVLTVPQRERLLPTLVSRSWVLTLPWPGRRGFMPGGQPGREGAESEGQNITQAAAEWARAMLAFADGTGRGWMERTARRGSLDAALATRVVLLCQACLLESLSGSLPDESACPEMSAAFARLAPASRHILSEALAECQDSLNYTVNPSLVLDWLATRLFFVFAGDARR